MPLNPSTKDVQSIRLSLSNVGNFVVSKSGLLLWRRNDITSFIDSISLPFSEIINQHTQPTTVKLQ